ncbi:MAG TPA: allophanate hydrolase [Frankiaceae bacterium]|nr:allophanate hydrolase [Frankiaceae bacterium]
MTLASEVGAVEQARAVAAAMGNPVFISVAESARGDGIPFVVKDNIDVEGLPTTVACPALDTPAPASATVVTRLQAAGYVPIAKSNMDQFATGLVGTRSPYGACLSVPVPDRISGGSSSGSAVCVASGVVSLALGTDTAGSGRVPAAFNGLVGFKPTRGLLSVRGVFPACRSLDCVTTFTHTVAEARTAFTAMAGFDPLDPWSRAAPPALPPGIAAHFGTIAIPDGPVDLDAAYSAAFADSVQRARNLGLRVVPVDVSAFLAAAQLLYEGPWVAERYAAFGHLLEPDADYLDPSVRAIAMRGREMSAAGVFEAFERLARLKRQSESVWSNVDALLLPTAPTHPTPAEVAADPLGVNARLGTFTNFVNLLDLCAVAVPGVDTADGRPFGVQLIAPAFADTPLLDLAATWMGEAPPASTPHPKPGTAAVALVGAHQSGLVLNGLVAQRGGRLLRRARTSSGYRMMRVPGPGVPRPGLISGDGPAEGFAVEIWEVPLQTLGSLAAELSAPLRLGPLHLADGSFVLGYLGDDIALASAEDVSAYGAWRAVPQ